MQIEIFNISRSYFIFFSVMLTKPQPHEAEAMTQKAEAVTHEAEAKTHEVEAKTHEAEAKATFFGLEADAKFEAKFIRRQRFEKLKN